MQRVACDLCGSDPSEPVLRRGEWTLVRCLDCGLVRLDPRPDPDALTHEFEWLRHAPLQTLRRRRKETRTRRLYRTLRRRIPRRSRESSVLSRIRGALLSGRLLDVGCGDGQMVAALRAAGYDAVGLDSSPLAVGLARAQGRDVARGTVFTCPYQAQEFDGALLMSYLEHEPHPTAALRRIATLLRPGGRLFLKVPHYGSWNRRVMGARWSGYFFPQHLYYFTPDTLARLLEKCGFVVTRNGFWDHVPLSDVFWVAARVSRPVSRPTRHPATPRVTGQSTT